MNTTTQRQQDVAAMAAHQLLHNALATAQWHLARGEIETALGRVLSVGRRLKVVAQDRKEAGHV